MSQYLLPSPIFDEKPTVSLFWGFLICNKLFFSCSFHYFLFVFGFPWIVWMWISLCSFFFFEVHWVYWMYMLMSFSKSGEILATIFSTSFYHFLEFLFTHMLVCLLVSHSSSKFCSEFFILFSSSSAWIICIDTSKFTNSIFCQLKSAVEPSL